MAMDNGDGDSDAKHICISIVVSIFHDQMCLNPARIGMEMCNDGRPARNTA